MSRGYRVGVAAEVLGVAGATDWALDGLRAWPSRSADLTAKHLDTLRDVAHGTHRHGALLAEAYGAVRADLAALRTTPRDAALRELDLDVIRGDLFATRHLLAAAIARVAAERPDLDHRAHPGRTELPEEGKR